MSASNCVASCTGQAETIAYAEGPTFFGGFLELCAPPATFLLSTIRWVRRQLWIAAGVSFVKIRWRTQFKFQAYWHTVWKLQARETATTLLRFKTPTVIMYGCSRMWRSTFSPCRKQSNKSCMASPEFCTREMSKAHMGNGLHYIAHGETASRGIPCTKSFAHVLISVVYW